MAESDPSRSAIRQQNLIGSGITEVSTGEGRALLHWGGAMRKASIKSLQPSDVEIVYSVSWGARYRWWDRVWVWVSRQPSLPPK